MNPSTKRARTVNLARVRANRARERALLDAVRAMGGPSDPAKRNRALLNMERAGWSRTKAPHALDAAVRARVAEIDAEIAAYREALDPDDAAFMFDAVSLPPIPPGEP